MDASYQGYAPRSAALPPLNGEERRRYSRHLALPGVGLEGQQRLKAARVLIVGAGGLGSPTALYLAAAGVGTIGLIDQDVVDVTNLQRQLLHGTRDVGRAKLESARDRLSDVNPHVQLELHATWLTSANALDLVGRYDVIIDGSDNFNTRYLVNDACVLLGKPNVHGSVFQFDGQASVFATEHGPCYRCLYPEPPPPGMVQNCAEGGVLGVLPGLIGTIQATETLKIILLLGDTLAGRLLMIDARSMQVRSVTITRDPKCPACGTRTLTQLIDYDQFCGTAGPASAVTADAVPEIAPAMLAARRARGDDFDLVDVREPHETAIERIDGARLIPLGTLPHMLNGLDRTRELVVLCYTGKRSAEAVRQLRLVGFSRATSLSGGLERWNREMGQTNAS